MGIPTAVLASHQTKEYFLNSMAAGPRADAYHVAVKRAGDGRVRVDRAEGGSTSSPQVPECTGPVGGGRKLYPTSASIYECQQAEAHSSAWTAPRLHVSRPCSSTFAMSEAPRYFWSFFLQGQSTEHTGDMRCVLKIVDGMSHGLHAPQHRTPSLPTTATP